MTNWLGWGMAAVLAIPLGCVWSGLRCRSTVAVIYAPDWLVPALTPRAGEGGTMKNRMAWGLAVLLAVLLLGGAGIGIRRTYYFRTGYRGSSQSFFLARPYGGMYYIALGPTYVAWWRRGH
jgi:hypothetical protein